MGIFDAISKSLDLFLVMINKIFLTPEEKIKTRKEKAKEAWDELRRQEKKVQEDLYRPRSPR